MPGASCSRLSDFTALEVSLVSLMESSSHGDARLRDRSFENTVQNKALPPCDLNSFMDYLYHVERRAETLQFFLWYCDYVERWSRLPPHQRQLAPAWGPELAAQDAAAMLTEATASTTTTTIGVVPPLAKLPKRPLATAAALPDRALRHHHPVNSSRPSSFGTRAVMATTSLTTTSTRVNVAIHTRSDSNKLKRILSILEDDDQARPGLSGLPALPTAPVSTQPFRDEVSRIVRHYLAADGPRALSDTDLFGPERAACLRAARRTTHPSALLPAFLAVEGVLRTQSFPAFAHRWCAVNAHGARLALGRALAAVLLLAGIALDVLLVVLVAPVTTTEKNAAPRHARLACLASLVLLWPALASLLASRTGIDVLLFVRRRRMLRPWEMDDDDKDKVVGDDSDSDGVDSEKAPSSTFSRLDPLRKPSLQALGPRNDPDGEPWAVRNTHRPLWRRLCSAVRAASASSEHTVAVQDPGIRALQEQAVRAAVLWAGLASVVAVVASLFIP